MGYTQFEERTTLAYAVWSDKDETGRTDSTEAYCLLIMDSTSDEMTQTLFGRPSADVSPRAASRFTGP
ncbi:MAG: hypothetical protein OJF47_003131 [Nitrospira sp.]|nr:MAG: hypothetical protein OJF47_003131 [Nitrospira sp.]